jgi:hypothetical protein
MCYKTIFKKKIWPPFYLNKFGSFSGDKLSFFRHFFLLVPRKKIYPLLACSSQASPLATSFGWLWLLLGFA